MRLHEVSIIQIILIRYYNRVINHSQVMIAELFSIIHTDHTNVS